MTSFNLIPAAQLDGGHVATALLGDRARTLTWIITIILMLMGFLWTGWVVWAVMILLFSRAKVEPLDNLTPLRPAEIRLAIALLIVAILTITPIPIQIL